MSVVLQECSEFTTAYLDGILIFSSTFEEHLTHLNIIFIKLLSLVVSMVMSFVLSFFPRGVLDETLNLIESVSEGFPSYPYVSIS